MFAVVGFLQNIYYLLAMKLKNMVALLHAEFAGREKILGKLVKPNTMKLSPRQNVTVVAFARSHYDRIGRLIVHQLTKNNIGQKTLVSFVMNTESDLLSDSFIFVCHNNVILMKFAED